jgi:hypothetical protein
LKPACNFAASIVEQEAVDADIWAGELPDAAGAAWWITTMQRVIVAATAYPERAGTPVVPTALSSHSFALFEPMRLSARDLASNFYDDLKVMAVLGRIGKPRTPLHRFTLAVLVQAVRPTNPDFLHVMAPEVRIRICSRHVI